MPSVSRRKKTVRRRKTASATRPVRRSRPEPLDIRSLPGPETILRRTYPNGITLLARENFLSPSVVVLGVMQAGGLEESEEKAGLAA
ncbi:MAG: hypothetical protein ACK2UB_07250, partial [Anaerolineales bacterium]